MRKRRATGPLGPLPHDPTAARRWRVAVLTIAAYRDRYQITSDLALGPKPRSEAQRGDHDRAAMAAEQAASLSRGSAPMAPWSTPAPQLVL